MKRFLLITCACLILAVPASANVSRVAGMGGIGLYMPDDTNVETFPQALADYSNRAIGELGFRGDVDSERWATANMHLKKLGVHLSMAANRPGPVPRFSFTNIADWGRHNAFGIAAEDGLWGLRIGFGADSWEEKFEDDPADGTLLKESSSTINVAGGLDFDYSETATGEVGAFVSLAGGTQEFQGDLSDLDESIFEAGVTLRNMYDRGEHGTLVALGSFTLASGDIDFPSASARGGFPEKDEVSGFAAGGGVAWHYPVAEGITVIPGVELFGFSSAENDVTIDDDNSEKDEISTLSYFSPFFGMEAWINSWWVARFGVKQSNTITTTKETVDSGGTESVTEFSFAESQFDLSFGVGIKLGDNFMVDGVFNEDLLYNGPNFLTGDSISGNFLSRVSIWGWW